MEEVRRHARTSNCRRSIRPFIAVSSAFAIVFSVCAAPAQSPGKSEEALYAVRNIEDGETILNDDIAIAKIERSKIPVGALKSKSEAVGRLSLGISCGQFIVPKRVPYGLNAGVRELGGVQPDEEIVASAPLNEGKIGVIDRSGRWIIAPGYCEIHYVPQSKVFWVTDLKHSLSEAQRASLKKSLGHYVYADTWQLLDHDGKNVSTHLPWYTEGIKWPQRKAKDLIIVARTGVGACDALGREIVSPTYDAICELDEGYLAALSKPEHAGKWHGRWLIFNSEGTLVTKLPLNVATVNLLFNTRLLACSFDHSSSGPSRPFDYGVIDLSGHIIIRPVVFVGPFSEGLAAAITDKSYPRFGYIDTTSRFVLPPIYSPYTGPDTRFNNGIAIVDIETKPFHRLRNGNMVMSESKTGAINHSGKVVLPFQYDYMQGLPNGAISAIKGSRCLVLGPQNFKPILSFDRDTFVYSWSAHLYQAMIHNNQKYQYLDEHGNKVGPEFASISEFTNGCAIAAVDRGLSGLIDTKGNWILAPRYSVLKLCDDDRYIAEEARSSNANSTSR